MIPKIQYVYDSLTPTLPGQWRMPAMEARRDCHLNPEYLPVMNPVISSLSYPTI